MSSIRVPLQVPRPLTDCKELHEAFHGFGCDAAAVIDILAHRNLEQRSEIKETYASTYEEDLSRRLKSELHFNFEKAMLLWMLDPAQRNACILREALKGRASRRKKIQILIETLCLCSTDELHCIVEAYTSRFGRSLVEDVESSNEGFQKKLFLTWLCAKDEFVGDRLDLGRTREDAKALFDSVDNANETLLLSILTSRGIEDRLLSILDAYRIEYGKDFLKDLKKAQNLEFQEAAIAVLKYMKNPSRWFAKTLYKAMKGLGTDDATLIRVVVTRAEVDMIDIKSEFVKKYKMSLVRTISSDTSGSYRQFLLTLIGSNTAQRPSRLCFDSITALF